MQKKKEKNQINTMLNLQTLSAQLRPELSLEDVKAYAAELDAVFPFTYPEEWLQTTPEQLSDPEMQKKLIKTLYDAQFSGEPQVYAEIVESFVEWTEGTIQFDGLSDQDNATMKRLFSFLGFLHFGYLSASTQALLLGGPFVLIAAHWDLPLYYMVQAHFARYMNITVLKTDADIFAAALKAKQTPELLSEWV